MIPAGEAHLGVATRSHPGMRGKNNEDRYLVTAHQLGADDPRRSLLAVVADGIGGHRAGEVAAELAVSTISEVVAASEAEHPAQTLVEAIIKASQAIHQQAKSNPEYTGMGATCVCAWIIDNQLFAASVGDSRMYLIQTGVIRQLTTDHTWIQEALDRKMITPQEAIGHPNMHIIRRYLGSQHTVVPDLRIRLDASESDEQSEANQGWALEPGDRLLLCSDGLSDLVSQNEIHSALRSTNMEAALESLIKLANARGGHDNITIVAIEYPHGDRLKEEQITGAKLKPGLWLALGALGMILCAGLAALVYFLFWVSSQILGFGG